MYTNWGSATSNFQIASNQFDVVSTGDTGPLLWSPTSFGATQQACVKLAAIDGNADDIALVLKAQSSTGLGNGLMEVLYDPTPGAIRVWTYDTTNNWVQRGTDLSATFAAGDTLRVVARSNGQVEIYKNTTLLGTRDASAWTYSAQGGYIGLWSLNGPNTLFDDFGGGTYAGASGPARADDPQPAAKALRRIAERQPAEQHSAALPSVVADLGRAAERAAQAVADIQARAHTWGLRSAAAQPEPKGAAALFAPIQRAPLAVTPVSPNAGEVFRLYVSAGARPVAVRSIAAGGVTSVQYLHPDHLGSIGQITNQAQGWVQDVYFKPYGGVRWAQSGILGPDSDSATRRSYTGQYEETSQWMGSLMHYKARYYSPFLHRFTQPDTIVPSAGNPQTLNRFGYARGNPVLYNDPSGHCEVFCVLALIVVALVVTADTLQTPVTPASSPQPRNYPKNGGGSFCAGSLSDCFGDQVSYEEDFSEHGPDNPIPLEEFESFADEVAQDLHDHEVLWPGIEPENGLNSGRAVYDTPFYNGGGSEARGRPNREFAPGSQRVCIEGHGCSARSDVNYIAQGMWGARVGETEGMSLLIGQFWKLEEYGVSLPPDAQYWVKYGRDHYQQWLIDNGYQGLMAP